MIARNVDVTTNSKTLKYHVLEYSADSYDVVEARKLNGGDEKRLRTIFFGTKVEDFERKFRFILNETSQHFEKIAITTSETIPNLPLDRIEYLHLDEIPDSFSKDLLGTNEALFAILKSKCGCSSSAGEISRKCAEEILAQSHVTTFKRASIMLGITVESLKKIIQSSAAKRLINLSSFDLELIDLSLLREFIGICKKNEGVCSSQEALSQEYKEEIEPELCYICRSFPDSGKPNHSKRYDIFYNRPICEMHSIQMRTSNAPHIPNDYTSNLICHLYPQTIEASWVRDNFQNTFKPSEW